MSFVEFLKNSIPKKNYSIADITIILCVRLTNKNSWIVKRLSLFSEWFSPCPNILIVDFGSEEYFAKNLISMCERNNYQYQYVNDDGIFCLSKARNEGFLHSTTDLIFFTDPDFIFERDIFDRLLNIVNATEMGFNSFSRITMPAYHVSQEYSEIFESYSDNKIKENSLLEWAFYGVYSDYSSVFEYISPYSNNFFCHRNYYDLVGGYSTDFVGHGSEDFEFIVRANLLQGRMPIPEKLNTDLYKPGIPTEERQKYTGFRRLAEVEAFSGELFGFRSFHIWHPRTASKGWYEKNDMKRKTFNTVLSRYINNKVSLLKEDYLHRDKCALCIVSDESHLAYFLPLRVLGYSLDVLSESSQINAVIKKVEQKKFDRAFIYNPYTEKVFGLVIDRIKSSEIPITVIERGALPNSLYYADDMSYRDPDFLKLTIGRLREFSANHSVDKGLLDKLKSGSLTLEKNADYQETLAKLVDFVVSTGDLTVFIPLQLHYDTAVTLFNEGYPDYEAFLNSIADAIALYPDVKFIIKSHPLLKEAHFPRVLQMKANNLYISNENENVHALIEVSDAVLVYNSGVGLLSLVHNKPVFHMGNAYYDVNQHFAKKVESINHAIEQLQRSSKPFFSEDDVLSFLCWLVNYKYSFFDAIDEYRVLEHRNSHAYQNIQVAIFNFDGKTYTFGSLNKDYSYSSNSYAAARLGLNSADDHRKYILGLKNEMSFSQRAGAKSFAFVMMPFISSFNKTLLNENPKQFFRTAKHPFSRWVGNKLGLR